MTGSGPTWTTRAGWPAIHQASSQHFSSRRFTSVEIRRNFPALQRSETFINAILPRAATRHAGAVRDFESRVESLGLARCRRLPLFIEGLFHLRLRATQRPFESSAVCFAPKTANWIGWAKLGK